MTSHSEAELNRVTDRLTHIGNNGPMHAMQPKTSFKMTSFLQLCIRCKSVSLYSVLNITEIGNVVDLLLNVYNKLGKDDVFIGWQCIATT